MSSFDFFPAALDALLAEPAVQSKLAVNVQPQILADAVRNCSVKYPGGNVRNPAPGTVNSGTGVYMRSEEFRNTLQLLIGLDGELAFSSPAVASRKGGTYDYGQALIDGRLPFRGPYRLLPPEYYI